MKVQKLVVGSLRTNCYILASQKELVIIDPGGEPGLLLRKLNEMAGSLCYIILTHTHIDHIGGVKKIRKETRASLLMHEKEKKISSLKADKLLKEGGEIQIGEEVLRVIHTPGHTPGSICLLGDGFIFTGDTIFQQGYGRTDLEGGSWKNLKASLQKLNEILTPGMEVYPGHGPSFVIYE